MENVQYKKLEDILTDRDYRTSNGTLVLVCDAELWEKTGIIEPTLRQMTPINFIPDDSLYHARGEWVTTTEPFCTVTPKEELEKIRQRQKEIFDKISNETFEECRVTFLDKLNGEVPDKKKFLEIELERYKAFELPHDLLKGYKQFSKIIPEHLDTGGYDVFGKIPNEEPKIIGYVRFGQWLENYQLSNEAAPPVAASTELKKKHAKTIQAEENYVNYTKNYIDLCKSVNPSYNRERAIEATLSKFNISEKTLGRAFDANRDLLIKFGHKEEIFKNKSRIKWS